MIAVAVACHTPHPTPSLQGRWIGYYQMAPAVFTFHGDTVAVALGGRYHADRFEHADTNDTSIVHLVRPDAWFKFCFVRDDSAVVIVNARDRIEVNRIPE